MSHFFFDIDTGGTPINIEQTLKSDWTEKKERKIEMIKCARNEAEIYYVTENFNRRVTTIKKRPFLLFSL